MSSKRIYNMVLKAADVCPEDERNKLLKQFNIPE